VYAVSGDGPARRRGLRVQGRDGPLRGHGVRVHHLPAGPPGLAKADLASHLCAFYLSFAAHPAARDLDVVHAHYWMSGWVARQAALNPNDGIEL
jgi:hypothetical protein